jgi:hypothetical protein
MENRKSVRNLGSNRAAIIHLAPGQMPIMCTVVDFSDGGAGLTVINVQAVPDQFELEIKGEDVRRICKVVWKKPPNRLGVSFESQ